MRRSILVGLAWVASTLFVSLLLLELVLQGAAWVRRARDGGMDNEPMERGDVYRILCIGESTTHGFGATSYPVLLEEELLERNWGLRFRVVNAGEIAVHTTHLRRRLPALIERYRPQMVIAMVGVNDAFYLEAGEALRLPLDLQLVLLRSRVYKLATLLWWESTVEEQGSARVTGEDPEHWRAFLRRFEPDFQRWDRGTLEAPEQAFRAVIAAAREAAVAGSEPGSLDLPDGYLRFYYAAHTALARVLLDDGRGGDAVSLYREAIELHPQDEHLHRGLAGVYEVLGNANEARNYQERTRLFEASRVRPVTRANRVAMQEEVVASGALFVAMQYPMRSLERLRFDLDDGSRTIFVDNEASFREAVARQGYDALFTDRMAGDFGHATEAGNRLVVRNLMEQVFERRFGLESDAETHR